MDRRQRWLVVPALALLLIGEFPMFVGLVMNFLVPMIVILVVLAIAAGGCYLMWMTQRRVRRAIRKS